MPFVAGDQYGSVRDRRCRDKSVNLSGGFADASQSAFDGAERIRALKVEWNGLNRIQQSGQLVKIVRSILGRLRPVIQLCNDQSAQRDLSMLSAIRSATDLFPFKNAMTTFVSRRIMQSGPLCRDIDAAHSQSPQRSAR